MQAKLNKTHTRQQMQKIDAQMVDAVKLVPRWQNQSQDEPPGGIAFFCS